jgi:hypothetical protein
VQGTADFELVKLNIRNLLIKRDRHDLIPVWDAFLVKFPDSAVDDKVPYDPIYERLVAKFGGPVR